MQTTHSSSSPALELLFLSTATSFSVPVVPYPHFCTVPPSFYFMHIFYLLYPLLVLLPNPRKISPSPCQGSGKGIRSEKPQWEIPCLSPVPHRRYKAPGCFDFLFELSHMGRESPGKSFSKKKNLLGHHITHHLRTSKGVWVALGILRAQALPGAQEDLIGLISTKGQALHWGFGGLEGAPGSARRAVGQALLQGAALGISKDPALLQLVSPWAVTLPWIWGALGFELGESQEIPVSCWACGPY